MAINDANLVSDEFWLNIGSEIVYNSLQALKDAVDRLQKTIGWVFGIYTSISIGSIVFNKKEYWDETALFLFGIAFLFLTISYWLATMASFLSPQAFYANAAVSVQNAYLNSIKKGKNSFRFAVLLCFLGILFYSIALFYQFGSGAIKKIFGKNISSVNQDTVLIKKVRENRFAVQIQNKPNALISTWITYDSSGVSRVVTNPFINSKLMHDTLWVFMDDNGQFSFIIEIPQKLNINYRLWISHTDTVANKNTWIQTLKKVTL